MVQIAIPFETVDEDGESAQREAIVTIYDDNFDCRMVLDSDGGQDVNVMISVEDVDEAIRVLKELRDRAVDA